MLAFAPILIEKDPDLSHAGRAILDSVTIR